MKARFYFDAKFSKRATDAESVAAALDNVIDVGLTTLDKSSWEEYGSEPNVGKIFVLDTAAAKEHADYLDSLIDGKEEDELGASLIPVRDFLRQIAGK